MTDRELARALARAEAGKSLNAGDYLALLSARGRDLDRLCTVAARIRDQGLAAAGRPGVITYSPKVFIPLTQLCRDRCHYCVFAQPPPKLTAPFLSAAEVLTIAQAGAARGCKEALFTLGDRPEERWPQARNWLQEHGYPSTLAYLRAMAELVLKETGLLPHANPGVLSWSEFQLLRPAAPSMGMMLETTSRALFDTPGAVHYGSPDKDPAIRLRVLEDAGRIGVPFTTGILVGIGESPADRVHSLLEIRRISQHYGSIQEVILQNFRAKPNTPLASAEDFSGPEFLATIAVARVLLGSAMSIQVPPNLSAEGDLRAVLAAGIDDWGGISPVTIDHVNPERPWPQLPRLRQVMREEGFQLAERLTVGPRFVDRFLRGLEPWIDPRLRPHVAALAGPGGLANPRAVPRGLPWESPVDSLSGMGRTDLAETIDTRGHSADQRGDFEAVYGDWRATSEQADAMSGGTSGDGVPTGVAQFSDDLHRVLCRALRDPAGLRDEEYVWLLEADGDRLDALAEVADEVRAGLVGPDVTYVVNRNINFTNICYVGCRFCAFAQRATDPDAFTLSLPEIAQRAVDAERAGVTELCLQGGISPDLGSQAYLDILDTLRTATPTLHIHAFSPMEISMGAASAGVSVREWLTELRQRGLGSIPGTAAEILDDRLRWVLTRGKLPAQAWIDVVRTAHDIGLKSSSTMMYGHIDQPIDWVRHLRVLRGIQDDTGGFTEFVPLPFVHTRSPIFLAGIARPGPTDQENRAVHAVARLLLAGAIANIQASWVKLGQTSTSIMLRGGANDIGGTLMEETISRMAGSEHGSAKSVAELESLGRSCGRPVRQRTTLYGVPGAGRQQHGLVRDRPDRLAAALPDTSATPGGRAGVMQITAPRRFSHGPGSESHLG
ncbi:MAG: bifunctional FO biosynthesis protein CofGH [Angustibacter sp.]